MSIPPETPTFPPISSPFRFTKLIEDMEMRQCFNSPSLEDEIEEFTQTEDDDVQFMQCTTYQVMDFEYFEIVRSGFCLSFVQKHRSEHV